MCGAVSSVKSSARCQQLLCCQRMRCCHLAYLVTSLLYQTKNFNLKYVLIIGPLEGNPVFNPPRILTVVAVSSGSLHAETLLLKAFGLRIISFMYRVPLLP